MGSWFTAALIKRILISTLSGVVIFLISWFYLNSYYTLNVEDALFSKETFFKHKLLKLKPKINKQFLFINTGKDLNLVDDTAGYGNIVVSDRYKLFKLLQIINRAKARPRFVLLDLQFYYPYNYSVDDSILSKIKRSRLDVFLPVKSIDDSVQLEIKKFKNTAITVLMDNNKIDTPIYKAAYGIANYTTYGSTLNKFRLCYASLHISSVPCLLNERMDSANYTGSNFATFCNHRLCFNYVWPGYYYNEEGIKGDSTYQEYHLGSLLSLASRPEVIEGIIKDKVIFIGNFEDDVHDTPLGRIPGTIILCDIYLSLLNGVQYVPYLWVAFLIVSFSGLSYMSIYNSLPDVKFNFGFLFANQVSSFLKEYISYTALLMLLSLLSVFIFNLNVSLFLPASIFSGIDFFRQKKYKPNQP